MGMKVEADWIKELAVSLGTPYTSTCTSNFFTIASTTTEKSPSPDAKTTVLTSFACSVPVRIPRCGKHGHAMADTLGTRLSQQAGSP